MSDAPQQIAGYRVVRTLGRGGMGTVYLAEQDEPVQRRVALKVLRHTMTDDEESSARFLAERHAMGRLDHPNIGRILEAGDEEGRPFFAMEWLDGLAIDHYCEEHQLSIPQRLQLFLGVCRGVAHAHQKQLLHRDLKPSNVLVIEVDGEPVPKVIDFGVAKALDQPLGGRDLKTQHVLGTPVYTSPEGLRLREVDLDTRTDVYSLGVLLCELLVGRRPHELGDDALGTFLRRKAEEDPTSPSGLAAGIPNGELERIAANRQKGATELRKALRGDLDWIVLRAVARQREDRYASATELAADIERHLRSEPIQARPPSVRYVVGRFVQRHRAAAVLAGALLLALLVGVAGLAVGLQRARQAEAQSRADAETARRAQEEAEAVSTFLSGLFLEASPYFARMGERTHSAELSAEELIERGAARASEELADQPAALFRVQSLLGSIYYGWGRYEEARQRRREALDLARQVGLGPLETADALIDLSEAEHREKQFETAARLLNEALAMIRGAAPLEPVLRGADVSSESVDRSRRARLEVRTLVGLARLARTEGDLDRSENLLRQAQGVDQAHSGVPGTTRLSIYTGLATLGIARDRPEDAEAPIRIAYDIIRRELPENHPRRVSVTNYYAVVLALQDKLDEAHPIFEETLALRRKLLGDRHPDVAEALNNLGVNLLDLGRPAEALPVHQEALDIRRESLGEEATYTAWSHDNLGVTYLDLGRYPEALDAHRRALAIRERVLDEDHPDIGRSLYFVGRLMDELGEGAAAVPYYRRSIAIRDAKLPADHRGNAAGRVRLGALLLRQGDDSGEELIHQGLAILESTDDEDLAELRELAESAGFSGG